VPVSVAASRIVQNTQMHDGSDVPTTKDVFHLLSSHVDLVVDDVLGAIGEWTAIDANDVISAVQLSCKELA
jgi:hypothetical protein